ncbi:serpin E3 isoform X2 [Pyxicephalus adspersus]|uniref:serpin E3 isoform X2 n=1 Tax=Pyxicephalus adspersus TaxID=30357 RepID=UPI003B594623
MPPAYLLLVLVFLFCVSRGYSHSYERLRELNTEFAVRLYQTLVETENRTNLVVSPSSVANSLGLLQFGARGSTFTQIENALGYNVHDESVQNFMKAMHKELGNSSQETSMHLACALFVQTGTSLSAQFIENAAMWANSSLHQANFSEHTWTANQINQWITRNTGGQFESSSFEKFTIVELPYLGNTVSMFVLRPTDKNMPLSSIEASLTSKNIALWTSSMKKFKMDIFMPRFKLQSHSDLKALLPALGVWDLFDPRKADFKGMSEDSNVYVSQAIHKAEIEVAEGGTRASGVTAMVLLKRSRMPVFKADRPFLFFLRQACSDSVLFIGRVTNPLH